VAYQPEFPVPPPFLEADGAWADSLMAELSLEERIGQMIMVQAYSRLGEAHERSVSRMITRDHVGGVAFFQGDPLSQARLTNRYQEESRVPLLVAMDAETGLGMRLEGTLRYPRQMVLGAVTDMGLLHELGRDIGRQMRRLGVHLNFAPLADVNNNPANPVIGTRSFGEDPAAVATRVIALMSGMQSEGLLVAAKHFPGHGDTDEDSHNSLPLILHDRQRLDSVELFPFREAVDRGLTGVMVGHLQVPALEDGGQVPATVSPKVIRDLLIGEMGFRGLVITDAMNMKGLSRYYEPGDREVAAVKAGNDILLMPGDPGKAIAAIRKAVRRGEIPEARINESCRKILMAKYWAGLASFHPVDTLSLLADLNDPAYGRTHRAIKSGCLTLVRQRDSLLPFRDLPSIRLATVTISREGSFSAGSTCDLYLKGDHYTMGTHAGAEERAGLLAALEPYNTVIVSILNTSSSASRQYGISNETVDFIASLDPDQDVVLNLAGYPYALERFWQPDKLDAVVLSYSSEALYQHYVMQALFGGRSFSGRLPVSAGRFARAGEGVCTGPRIRLAYAEPMDAGLHPDTLARMETLIREAISRKAMPGCQVLVARGGQVVWHRAYGHHSYQGKVPVRTDDLYDLASITKIAATLPALMKLCGEGRFSEDSLLGAYAPIPDSSDKAGLKIADILAHQAGLVPWIPFYQATLEPLDSSQRLVSHNWSHQYPLKIGPSDFANRDVKYVDSTYESSYSPAYPVQVAGHLYLRADLRDSVYRWIHESRLLEPEYRYSDLGYYLLQQVIEEETDTLLYPYVWYNFFAPLGAESLGFLPLNRFPRERIVPTENDLFFRRQLLQGYVHDPGTAMLGGISGHAGLFGNANDLAKMMQMYLDGGEYGGQRYLDEAVLERYTSCYDCGNGNRRGLGFDRRVAEDGEEGPACDGASALSFGHSGFTGTLAWVDPEYGLVFIFLSNRIHPDQGNTRLIDENVRTRIQQVVYDALMD
jgi:beta-N-acetylhexosaminidase